jgi:Tfp pilus assembly protein PilV
LTLVEVMVAIVILTIVLIGTSSMYVSGRRQIIKQGQYQEAVHLTSQKLEEIKAIGYFGIAQGEQEEELALRGLTCQRHTKIEPTAAPTAGLPNPCKKVTVTTRWTDTAADQHEVKLVTYIGP